MITNTLFSRVAHELPERAGRATVSQLGPANQTLANHLRERFGAPMGQTGSFLAPPVVESLFDWEKHDQTFEALPWLARSLIASMDAPPKELAEYHFPRTRYPFAHQYRAWKALAEEPARSVLVSTGTASGKTECFLVPILNDLAHELEKQPGSGVLEGVRALFLYPLNALINSQRRRLEAWTSGFGNRMRFCLYNGATPHNVQTHKQKAKPCEVLSRAGLRESPAPILVTNATMLEFMLVRAEDEPILQKSQGGLRWIVLDEAHTYVGSQAAELALLLRRVLHAFGADRNRVRFVATSATIGAPGAQEELRRYLADLAGVDKTRVEVITGRRVAPELPEALSTRAETLPAIEALRSVGNDELFERLGAVPEVRALREALREGPRSLPQAAALLLGVDESAIDATALDQTLEVLDHCAQAHRKGTDGADESLLPLRAHFFQRNQRGLWACCNGECTDRADGLDTPEWRFGKVFLERRESCDACESIVFPVVFCHGCGAEYLLAQSQQNELRPWMPGETELDAAEAADVEEDEAEEDTGWPPNVELISGLGKSRWSSQPVRIDPKTGQMNPGGDTPSCAVHLVERRKDESHRLRCARCGQFQTPQQELFRPVRLGAPFYLGVAIPALLEVLPPEDDKAHQPAQGRRLITFSDSRQGTARFALRSQLESERNYVRSLIYHMLWSDVKTPDTSELETVRAQVEKLAPMKEDPVFRGIWEQKCTELARLESAVLRPTASLSWIKAIERLASEKAISEWIATGQRQRYRASELKGMDIARIALFREFVRRPKRQNSLETLGLVALHYPGLEEVTSTPPEWQAWGLSLDEWRAFLKVAVDFFVRAHTAVQIPPGYLRWFGTNISTNFVVAPDGDTERNRIYAWPSAPQGQRLARMARLLVSALNLNKDDPEQRGEVDAILRQAWSEVHRKVLTGGADGYYLDFDKSVELRLVNQAWICPVTRRVLDTTLRGVSPYQTESWADAQKRCEQVVMPRLPHAFGRVDGAYRPDVLAHWPSTDDEVKQARAKGVWTEFSDRIASMSLYFQVAEHSAQISNHRLEELEEQFQAGLLNVLSCSTTMEMGIDIGGLSCVAMNNAPPGPANFLQRAGRAGRRGQSQALTLTNCQTMPHGEAVFRNPMWPFTTPVHVPTVSLSSERIVRRHVNALVLARFLRELTDDQHRLTCAWFFTPPQEGAQPYAERFRNWLVTEAENDKTLVEGVRSLVTHTALEAEQIARVFFEPIGESLQKIASAWQAEHDLLQEELKSVGGPPQREKKSDPVQRALWVQLCRLRDDYLLKALANQGFLPSYGFPLHVMPFVNITAEQLEAERKARDEEESREDDFGRRRSYPSRPLAVAIREYAPGNSVVIDGVVYDSGGLTMHWRLPPQDEAQHTEAQLLEWAWRCTRTECDANGTAKRMPERCPQCREVSLKRWQFLEPSGFAVDISARPHNDLSRQQFIPVQDPWISVHVDEWQPLVNPAVGRFRYDPDGTIFYWSSGTHGHGYAVCLKCGRAASERGPKDKTKPPQEMNGHKRLRGGRDKSGDRTCPGNHESSYAVRRNLRLGGVETTDVVELQLSDPASAKPVRDATVCTTLAVALRQALAESLGIDMREIGWAVRRARDGHRSILLYDATDGGAGYVASVGEKLPGLLRRAREILDCPHECDSACHGCLLAFDTQDAIEHLNRHDALEVVTEAFMDALSLPPELEVFGPETVMEFTSVTEALIRTMKPGMRACRIYIGGNPGDWLFSDWRLWPYLVRWAHERVRVCLVLPADAVDEMFWDEAHALASRIEGAGLEIALCAGEGVQIGDKYLVAEVEGPQGSTRWAASDIDALCPGDAWGSAGASEMRILRHTGEQELPALSAEMMPASELRKPMPGSFRELRMLDQLDGELGDVGEKFWAAIEKESPQLAKRLATGPALASLEYSDRYLNSPLVARTLYEMLRALRQRPGGLDAGAKVEVKTEAFKQSKPNPKGKLDKDWRQVHEKQAVLECLFSELGSAVVEMKDKHDLRHDRGFLLSWPDGTRFELRLDQGVGFLQSTATHDFEALPEQQAIAIRQAKGIFVQKQGSLAVPIYISGPHKS